MDQPLYAPLLQVSVSHAFFPDGRVPGLHWESPPATDRLLERAGCIARPVGSGLQIFYDSARRDHLAACLADRRTPMRLTFRWSVREWPLEGITEGVPREPGRALFVCSRRAVDEPHNACWRLHRAPEVGAADFRRISRAPLRPAPVVRLRLGPEDLPSPDDLAGGRHLRIRLAARKTWWKYFFVGAQAAGQLRVVDLQQQVEFSAPEPETLADGRTALCARSLSPIALQQRPAERFQLVRRDADGHDQVVLARLPAASGAAGPVSEIYV
jgi:hypothetical protein